MPVALGSGVGGQTIIPKAVSIWERYTPAAEKNTPCSNGLKLTRSNIGVTKTALSRTRSSQATTSSAPGSPTRAAPIKSGKLEHDFASVTGVQSTTTRQHGRGVWVDGDSFTTNPLPDTWKWSSNANSYTIEFDCRAKTGETQCLNIVATRP